MTPLVSVLIVTYDQGIYVAKAVDSVLEQTYTNLEVLILDDGSKDPMVQSVIWRALDDHRVHAYRFSTTNDDRASQVTYAANINYGAAHSQGEYLTFLAGDDYYHPDRCERMVAKLLEGNDVVYGSQERPNANGRFVAPLAEDILDDAYNRVDMSSVTMTRAAFDRSGGFPTDPAVWGDADAHFWRRVSAAGYRFVPVDDPERFTDAKPYRDNSVQDRVNRGLTAWIDE